MLTQGNQAVPQAFGFLTASQGPSGPPPFTFSTSRPMPSSRCTATACAAKASFTSNSSMSRTSAMPARSMAARTAFTGPMPMMAGSSALQA